MIRDEIDRSGVIGEAYRIDGIGSGECRSIFLDWALTLPAGVAPDVAIGLLLKRYGQPGHPMTQVLQDGLTPAATPRRRGGAASRRS